MKLLFICIWRVLLSHSFIFFRFYFFINVCMVLFLFDNVIYVFLLLWLCILILCLCMAALTEVFPCFFLSCKANARVNPAKTGTARTVPNFCCCSIYCLCCSMYCFFCDVLCIVCVYMCTVLLPPGGYPISVKYIIYDMIYLTANELTTGGSSTVHIYTQRVNRTTQNKQYIEQHNSLIWKSAVYCLCVNVYCNTATGCQPICS
jgi:hypothetical protein